MTLVPILCFWGAAAWGMCANRKVLVYLFFATIPLGTFAVVPPGMAGGVSLLASAMSALLIAIRELFVAGDASRVIAGRLFRSGLTRSLSAFWLASVLVTIFIPRLRAGDISVIALSGSSYGPAPLGPSMQNFTQMAYLTVSILATFSFARVFRTEELRDLLFPGLAIADGVALLSGTLDYLSSYLPTAALLTPFRTATYSIMDDAVIGGGTRRVIGLMPEASSFGYTTMGLFALTYFLRPASPTEEMRRLYTRLSTGLGVMVVLSTSSAGYAALLVVLALMALHWVIRTSSGAALPGRRRGTRRELLVALGLVALILVVWMVSPATLRPAVQRFEDLVVAKRDSDSYVERSMWTRVSLRAGLSSGLLGVGLGSTRASNYAAVLFASTGLGGFVLYGVFAGRLLLRPIRDADGWYRDVAGAMRWSFYPLLAINLMIGVTVDFGVLDALRWGVLIASLETAGRSSIRSLLARGLSRSAWRATDRRPPGPLSAAGRVHTPLSGQG